MTEQAPKKSKPIIYIILLAILLLLVLLLGYMYINTATKVEDMTVEKEMMRTELQNELNALLQEHNDVKSNYGRLSDTLASRDSLIQANASEIKELLNYKWEYFQIKKKLDRLRDVAKGYVNQMDSLYRVNEDLKQENQRIRESFKSEQVKNVALQEQRIELETIVQSASVLRAYNIKSTGIRQRGARQKETDKANRTDRVQICFTLGENMLVKPGIKSIYFRIARPDGVILVYDTGDEYTFTANNTKLQYSIKRDVKYEGEAMDLCVYWDKKSSDEDAMVGRYLVSVYMDGQIVGESFFELR
jgi:Tfp pilus assembly protein PilN